MICPACGKDIDKLLRGGLCSNMDCKAPLKKVIRDNEKGIPETMLEFRKPKDVKSEDNIEEFTTTYHSPDVKIERSDRNNYIVTFYKRMNYNWIYCPSCESKMFQSNIVKGSQEHKCHKCKSVITYVFR
jgi:hypothetical protein